MDNLAMTPFTAAEGRAHERALDSARAREKEMAGAIDELCVAWDPKAPSGDIVTPAMVRAYAALCRVSEDLINA